MEQKPSYLGTRSDFFTHVHDLPPQLGGKLIVPREYAVSEQCHRSPTCGEQHVLSALSYLLIIHIIIINVAGTASHHITCGKEKKRKASTDVAS